MLFLGVDVILDRKKKVSLLSIKKYMLEPRNGLIVTISTEKKTHFLWPCLWHTYFTNPDPITTFFFLMENKNHPCTYVTSIYSVSDLTFCFRKNCMSFSFYFGLSIECFLLNSIAKWDGHSKTIPFVSLFILFSTKY